MATKVPPKMDPVRVRKQLNELETNLQSISLRELAKFAHSLGAKIGYDTRIAFEPTKLFGISVEVVTSEDSAEGEKARAPYGYCPHCKSEGRIRERHPQGNDTCREGHVYPSVKALSTREPKFNLGA